MYKLYISCVSMKMKTIDTDSCVQNIWVLKPHCNLEGRQTVHWLFNIHNTWFLWIPVVEMKENYRSTAPYRHTWQTYTCTRYELHVCTWCVWLSCIPMRYTIELEWFVPGTSHVVIHSLSRLMAWWPSFTYSLEWVLHSWKYTYLFPMLIAPLYDRNLSYTHAGVLP